MYLALYILLTPGKFKKLSKSCGNININILFCGHARLIYIYKYIKSYCEVFKKILLIIVFISMSLSAFPLFSR